MVKDKWHVVIRTFGGRNFFLKEALYSLVIQNYPNLEVDIVYTSYKEKDEQGYQKAKEIVKELKNYLTIKEFDSEFLRDPKRTKGEVMNVIFEKIDGEFLSFLDDDDIYYPEFSSKLIKEAKKDNITFVYGDSIVVNYEKVENYYYVKSKAKGYGEEFNKIKLLLDNYIPFNTFVLNTSLIKDITFESINLAEDWGFILDLVHKKEFSAKYLPVPVSEYRKPIDKSNTGFTDKNRDEAYQARQKMLKEKVFAREFNISGNDLEVFSEEYYHLVSRNNAFAEVEKSRAIRVLVKLWYRPWFIKFWNLLKIPMNFAWQAARRLKKLTMR